MSLRVCASLPVNSTLIALALQLGDLQSEGNFGINKKDITKVSECVIILRASIRGGRMMEK